MNRPTETYNDLGRETVSAELEWEGKPLGFPEHIDPAMAIYILGLPEVLNSLKDHGYRIVDEHGDPENVKLFEKLIQSMIEVSDTIYDVPLDYVKQVALDPCERAGGVEISFLRIVPKTVLGVQYFNLHRIDVSKKNNSPPEVFVCVYCPLDRPSPSRCYREKSLRENDVPLLLTIPNRLKEKIVPLARDFLRAAAMVHIATRWDEI